MQDADDTSIPDDVRTRLLDYATAGLAVAQMKGEAYLSMGSVSMGIAGSVVNPEFFGAYLGMRNEYIDMSEFTRRIDEGIYEPTSGSARTSRRARTGTRRSGSTPTSTRTGGSSSRR